MASITVTCSCGAKAEIADNNDLWVGSQLEKFLKAHAICRERKSYANIKDLSDTIHIDDGMDE